MSDPIAVKNAKRVLPEHRIVDIQFRIPGAYITCSCGWTISFSEKLFTSPVVEFAWNTHKRDMGVTSHR